jgi:uncharacterized membrane protein YfcA
VSNLALLGMTSFIAWFISMSLGGGSPLLLIPVISVILGIQAVAPVLTIGLALGQVQRSAMFWDRIHWSLTSWYLPGGIAGAVVGSYLLTQIHLEGLQLVIGLILLLMVLNHALSPKETAEGPRSPAPALKLWFWFPLAFINAVGAGIVGSTGPIMNPVYLAYGLDKEELIGTKALHNTCIHLTKLCAYLALGACSLEHLGYGLLIGLVGLPANVLGKQVLARISQAQFERLLFAFMALSGMWMIWGQRGLVLGFVQF